MFDFMYRNTSAEQRKDLVYGKYTYVIDSTNTTQCFSNDSVTCVLHGKCADVVNDGDSLLYCIS